MWTSFLFETLHVALFHDISLMRNFIMNECRRLRFSSKRELAYRKSIPNKSKHMRTKANERTVAQSPVSSAQMFVFCKMLRLFLII
jgi:hypothetical protein